MNTKLQESKLARMLRSQKQLAWDMDRDIDWTNHNFDRPLLPLGEKITQTLQLSEAESIAFSQLLGLIATQAISEHEKALQFVKMSCWETPLQRLSVPSDMIKIGEQFFAEEAKHSMTFARYIEMFASHKDIPLPSLLDILPTYKDSLASSTFRLNSKLGGRSVWWLVMLTEEESLDLYRSLRPVGASVDPLFFQMHELHFQEEVRHISYAPLMLRKLGGSWISKLDYRLAVAIHFFWILQQLRRLKKLTKLRTVHPFFNTLSVVYDKFTRLPMSQRWKIVFQDTPFLSPLFRPMRHQAMRIEIKRNGDLPSLFDNHFSPEGI